MFEQLQGYRTIIFNLLMAVIAAVRVIWPGVIPADDAVIRIFDALWGLVMVLGNIYWRKQTTGPVGVKSPVCE